MRRLLFAIALAFAFPASPVRAEDPPECTIVGTAGNDVLVGTSGNDVICAFAGDDTIVAGPGNDTVYAGPGADAIWGGDGSDALYAESGNDWVDGDSGVDRISGGEGFDYCIQGESSSSCSRDNSLPRPIAVSLHWDGSVLDIRVRMKDTGSGFWPTGDCSGDQCGSFSMTFKHYRDSRANISVPQFQWTRLSGGPNDGIYEAHLSIPPSFPAGVYELYSIWVRDAAGNEGMYRDGLTAMKLKLYFKKGAP
jgi:hypothetical protein